VCALSAREIGVVLFDPLLVIGRVEVSRGLRRLLKWR
jgi:hypothetical protein